MDRITRFLTALDGFPPKERETIRRSILRLRRRKGEREALEAAMTAVLAAGRITAKRESDRRTDASRRVLVGARVRREFADRCRESATASGLSLYAWVVRALQAALKEA